MDESTEGASGSESDVTVANDPADAPSVDSVVFASFADDIPTPLVAFDERGTIEHVNAAFETEFGYDADDAAGTSIETVCPGLSMAGLEAGTADARSRRERQIQVRTVDGADRSARVTIQRRPGREPARYVATVQDVTDLRSRIRRLEQYERIVDTIDDGVYILDDAFNLSWVNDAVTELTGYSESELVGSNVSLLATEETIEQAAAVSEALLAGDGEAATITTTLATANGSELPIETRFSVFQFGDGSYGQVGVVRDVSQRIRYEQALTALHDATRDLLGAETNADVCAIVANAVTDVLDLSAAALYLFDADTNVLRPAATAVDADLSLGDFPLVGVDGGDVWDAFVSGERCVDTDGPPLTLGDEVELPAESGVAVPLGEHGVLFAAMATDERLDPDTMELIDLVAAGAEAALERVDRESSLRERDRELRERNERLRRLQAINEVIRRVDQAMVGADSRQAVESAVCTELVESELCSFAWIGRVSDGEVVPDAWAGDDPQYLDAIDRSLDGDAGPPAVRTARSGEPTVIDAVASDLGGEAWRRAALSREFQSAISVPLVHEDVTDGVLTVYAPRSEEFDEATAAVFEELGTTVANALRVVETKQWLSAERVVELDLAVEAPMSPLAAVARESGATLTHEGTVPAADGNYTFLRVDGADIEAVQAIAVEKTAVADVSQRSADDGDSVLEVHLTTPTVPTTLADQSSRIRSLAFTPDAVDATVAVPPTADVRALVESLDGTFQSAALEGRRDSAAPTRSEGGFRTAAEDRLTDRQWQMLRAAFLSGFFDWPRSTTGEEIADTFDVSQPTVNRHLRVGERKLLDLLFDDP